MIFMLGVDFFLLSSPSLPSHLSKAIIHDLFDVMDHAVQQPLDIYFDFAPEGKTVQALLSPEVGKNRFGYGEPLRVNLLSLVGIYLGGHSLG